MNTYTAFFEEENWIEEDLSLHVGRHVNENIMGYAS
jgi:hypothetical protein